MEKKLKNIKSISIRLASPDEILSWSHGEVTKPETLNYRTQRPEKHGLFSERIFGPTKDYECYCGKYRKFRYKDVICEKCGVEVTRSVVRRDRMGHVSLAVPVTHIWFLRTVPSKLSLMLDLSVPKLEKIVYYAAFIVTTVNEEARKRVLGDIKREFKSLKSVEGKETAETAKERSEDIIKVLQPGLILTEEEYYELSKRFGDVFEADRGAGAIRKILEGVNMSKLHSEIIKDLETVKDFSRRRRMLRRLRVVKSFMRSGIRPEWMVLTHIPILPPDLRPMVALDGGRYATADLNDLYRRVINRNNRLKKLMDLSAPDVIITNEKRMLQEAVDALIDNASRTSGQILSSRRRPLKSLSDMLKGKQGRFRQNLLGKRVDYSARSVIVIGPQLNIDQCGLPKKLALEIFRPFVIQKIIANGLAHNIKQANRLIEQSPPEVWEILEEVIVHRRILLNRAPTLHRLGVQAFKPLLTEDSAIRVPALVCDAFNADFDGDQMAVHLPLTLEAQYEARELLDSKKGVLKPANGDPIADPSKDIVLGCYFLTSVEEGAYGEGKVFSTVNEAMFAYEQGIIDITAKILFPAKEIMSESELEPGVDVPEKAVKDGMIETTYGRVIFNGILPSDFEFVNSLMNKKELSKLVLKIVEQYGIDNTSFYLDAIKRIGFTYSTVSAITWGMTDTKIPKEKKEIIIEGEKEVELIESHYNDGLLTNEERREKVIEVWTSIREKIAKHIPNTLTNKNPVYSIIDSGARGSWSQPIQMMGMKGLVINPKGEIIELPVKSSYKEGLSVLEYFISTHGARKGSTDTALKTASAGYLTRRLVDVSQDVIVRGEDCGSKKGLEISKEEGLEYGYEFCDRLYSRTALSDIKIDGKVCVSGGEVITKEASRLIDESGASSVVVRSPITCEESFGICAKCYGYDLSIGKIVQMGEAVGVIAAQSIGEPGTQLTMRTFHIGGVAGVDITHGLPRVEEVFEARTPKGKAPLAKSDGVVVDIEKGNLTQIIRVKPNKATKSKKKDDEYSVSSNISVFVKKGDAVSRGQQLCEGPLDVQEVFEYRGHDSARKYVINEIQKIYVPEGASISDKHIEVIVRQMFARVIIKDPGDTEFVVGEMVDASRLRVINAEIKEKGNKEAESQQLILGITRVALTTESFLSSASFQETSRVLVNASIEGRKDDLIGLKENVIIGKLIPVGTGSRGISKEKLDELREKLFPYENMLDVVEPPSSTAKED